MPAIFLFIVSPLLAGSVLYVDQDAAGANDGSSWQDAYTDLQLALTNATPGVEIWVAQGTYLPGADPSDAFVVDVDLQLLGGFQGGESSANDRDPAAYPTILSGDLVQDDLPGQFDTLRTDNALTILILELGLTPSAVIDGLIIRGGHAAGDDLEFHHARGGGVFSYGKATIRNCRFEENFATIGGGALFYQGVGADGAILELCSFTNNRSIDGGALMLAFLQEEGLEVNACIFSDNRAFNDGGAIKNFNSRLYLNDCTFSDNTSLRDGGGLEVQYQGYLFFTEITNCVFLDNQSSRGGAIRFNITFGLGTSFHALRVDDCLFSNNAATLVDPTYNGSYFGGAISYNLGGTSSFVDIELINSTFSGNQSDGRGGAVTMDLRGMDLSILLDNLVFTENAATERGALDIRALDSSTGEASFSGLFISGNSALLQAGGMELRASEYSQLETEISGVEFNGNQAGTYGGGLVLFAEENGAMNLQMESCLFDGNVADERGGAMAMSATNDQLNANLHYLQFVQNSSPEGAVLAGFPFSSGNGETIASSVLLDHWLVTENNTGSLIRLDSFTTLNLRRSTLSGNDGPAFTISGNSRVILQNTILNQPDYPEWQDLTEDGTLTSLGGNLIDDDSANDWALASDITETDPLLGDIGTLPATPQPGSPVVDAGIITTDTPPLDIYGNPRVQGNGIDIGAVESELISSVTDLILGLNVSIFPNPVGTDLNLLVDARAAASWQLDITDISGRVLRQHRMVQPVGGATYTLSVEELPTGRYWLVLHRDGQRVALPFTKAE